MDREPLHLPPEEELQQPTCWLSEYWQVEPEGQQLGGGFVSEGFDFFLLSAPLDLVSGVEARAWVARRL